MHPKSNPDKPPTDLQLERLPNGEHAWLRPAPPISTRRYILPSRYVLTDQGRRVLAEALLEEQREIDHAQVQRHLERVHAELLREIGDA